MKKNYVFLSVVMLAVIGSLTCIGATKPTYHVKCIGYHNHEVSTEHHFDSPVNGKGYYTCSNCNGTGHNQRIKCRSCRGAGEIYVNKTCPTCSGKGTVRDNYGNVVRCTVCSGKGSYKGKEYCSSCGGWGCVTCSKCGGSGKVWVND